jgi:hypothetical protein
MKIAVALIKRRVALIKRHISVHEALTFQAEMRRTDNAGLFLRDFPGQLALYPIESAICANIFYGSDWIDGYVTVLRGSFVRLDRIRLGFHWRRRQGTNRNLHRRLDGHHQWLVLSAPW